MELILYTANCTGNASNCVYPHKIVITNSQELKSAIQFDHVCAKYRDNYRSNDNFEEAAGFFMDNDNDHSNNPADWISAEQLEEILSDIVHAIAPSRHNMLPKNGKAARPRQHVYIPSSIIRDKEKYVAVKKAIQNKFSFFDDNAIDAARFFFGSNTEDVIWHEGWLKVDDLVELDNDTSLEADETVHTGPILEGSRNNTMSRFAGRVLKRYGITEKARDAFLEHAKKCDPPLPDEELDTIWASAVRFFNKKVVSQEGYVPPEEYNADFVGVSLKPEDYSDIGEAKVLVREYGDELKYTNATEYLRFDGDCWQEDKQLAIGAVEEFMDLQLADARDEGTRATEALIGAGVPEELIRAGGATLAKAVSGPQMGPYFVFQAAQAYLKFVMKRRDYKYIVSTANTAKPMLAISISDLDKDENLLNTPMNYRRLLKKLSSRTAKITIGSGSSYLNVVMWLMSLLKNQASYIKRIVRIAC